MVSPELSRLIDELDQILDLDPRLDEDQIAAILHLRSKPRSGLFYEMGLGKTAIALQTLQPQHLPVLVIATKRITENVWEEERDIWRPDLSIAVAAGTPAKRKAALNSGADIVAISRDNIKDVVPGQFKTIIIDELSSFKRWSSMRFKTARKFCDKASYVWGMTGTPSPNGIINLWSQTRLIDKGERLGTSSTAFKSRYFYADIALPNGGRIPGDPRPESFDRIMEKVSDIFISRKAKKDRQPIIERIHVPLSPAVRKKHDQLLRDLIMDKGDGDFLMTPSIANAQNKTSQITAGFVYDEDGSTIRLHNNKTDAVVEIIEATDSPVLVFYQFKAELEALKKAIPEARTADEKGVFQDWNAGKVPVLLAHPASAGHGLNLQKGGHTIIWTTLTWDLELWLQANARLDRRGQTEQVIIYLLIAPDTIDVVMDARLNLKEEDQDKVMKAFMKKIA